MERIVFGFLQQKHRVKKSDGVVEEEFRKGNWRARCSRAAGIQCFEIRQAAIRWQNTLEAIGDLSNMMRWRERGDRE